MKFFKHYEDASNSEFVQMLETKHGLIGYARWMKLLELACKNFDGESTILRLTKKEIAAKLGLKLFNVEKVVQSFVDLDPLQKVIRLLDYSYIMATLPPTLSECKVECNYNQTITKDLIIIIDMLILLQLQDRDFKRARKERANSAPKNKINKKKKNTANFNLEIDEGNEPDDSDVEPIGKLTPADIHKLWNSRCEQFGMAKVIVLNKAREKKVITALKVVKDLNDWKKIFSVASTKGFVAKDGNVFTPNFDYVFRNNNYISFLESHNLDPVGPGSDDDAVINSFLASQGVRV